MFCLLPILLVITSESRFRASQKHKARGTLAMFTKITHAGGVESDVELLYSTPFDYFFPDARDRLPVCCRRLNRPSRR